MQKVINIFDKVATFSADPDDGGNTYAHFLSVVWSFIADLGKISGALAGLLGKVQA